MKLDEVNAWNQVNAWNPKLQRWQPPLTPREVSALTHRGHHLCELIDKFQLTMEQDYLAQYRDTRSLEFAARGGRDDMCGYQTIRVASDDDGLKVYPVWNGWYDIHKYRTTVNELNNIVLKLGNLANFKLLKR
jgi:hypothetical protein